MNTGPFLVYLVSGQNIQTTAPRAYAAIQDAPVPRPRRGTHYVMLGGRVRSFDEGAVYPGGFLWHARYARAQRRLAHRTSVTNGGVLPEDVDLLSRLARGARPRRVVGVTYRGFWFGYVYQLGHGHRGDRRRFRNARAAMRWLKRGE